MRTLLKWLGILLALLVVAVGTLLLVFDWSWLKEPIEDYVRKQTGRTLTIGELRGNVSLTPRIHAEAVTFANADWSDEPYMVQVRRLDIRIELLQLLQGNLVASELILTGPILRLQQSAQGNPNWHFMDERQATPESSGKTADDLPIIRKLTVTDLNVLYHDLRSQRQATAMVTRMEGHLQEAEKSLRLNNSQLTYTDQAARTEITATLTTLKGETQNSDQRVTFQGDGQVAGEPLHLEGHAGSRRTLRSEKQPYPMQITLGLGKTRVHLDGTLKQPLQIAGLEAHVHVEGPDPAVLSPLLPIPIPHLPAYQARERLLFRVPCMIFP